VFVSIIEVKCQHIKQVVMIWARILPSCYDRLGNSYFERKGKDNEPRRAIIIGEHFNGHQAFEVRNKTRKINGESIFTTGVIPDGEKTNEAANRAMGG
jgi:hypothetical protein